MLSYGGRTTTGCHSNTLAPIDCLLETNTFLWQPEASCSLHRLCWYSIDFCLPAMLFYGDWITAGCPLLLPHRLCWRSIDFCWETMYFNGSRRLPAALLQLPFNRLCCRPIDFCWATMLSYGRSRQPPALLLPPIDFAGGP